MRGDHGRVVIGSITKIVLCLALLVVLFHDGVVLGLAHVGADQDAEVAARAAAQNYSTTKDPTAAYKSAALAVAADGTEINESTFRISGSGTVTLTASRSTSTMIANHFHFFDTLTHPTATITIEPEDQ